MRRPAFLDVPLWVAILIVPAVPAPSKEHLTPLEIEKIQEAQEIDLRVKIYLEAATLRLRASQERLSGKESAPGDPLEYFTVEDMLDSYNRIVRSVMLNLDGAAQKPGTDPAKFSKALKHLKENTEKSTKELGLLKRMAEDKRLEQVWNLVNVGIDITNGAHEGAELGLSREARPNTKKN